MVTSLKGNNLLPEGAIPSCKGSHLWYRKTTSQHLVIFLEGVHFHLMHVHTVCIGCYASGLCTLIAYIANNMDPDQTALRSPDQRRVQQCERFQALVVLVSGFTHYE